MFFRAFILRPFDKLITFYLHSDIQSCITELKILENLNDQNNHIDAVSLCIRRIFINYLKY